MERKGQRQQRTIDSELKKMPGYRAGKPLLASFTYLADPKTGDKEDIIDMGGPGLINGFVNSSDACTSSESSGPLGFVSKSHSRRVAVITPPADCLASAGPASCV